MDKAPEKEEINPLFKIPETLPEWWIIRSEGIISNWITDFILMNHATPQNYEDFELIFGDITFPIALFINEQLLTFSPRLDERFIIWEEQPSEHHLNFRLIMPKDSNFLWEEDLALFIAKYYNKNVIFKSRFEEVDITFSPEQAHHLNWEELWNLLYYKRKTQLIEQKATGAVSKEIYDFEQIIKKVLTPLSEEELRLYDFSTLHCTTFQGRDSLKDEKELKFCIIILEAFQKYGWEQKKPDFSLSRRKPQVEEDFICEWLYYLEKWNFTRFSETLDKYKVYKKTKQIKEAL